MMDQTGCDGVVIGRGCLGRPWLFRELADLFGAGRRGLRPTWARSPRSWLSMRVSWCSCAARRSPCPSSESTQPGTSPATPSRRAQRQNLCRVQTLSELEDLLATLDPTLTIDPSALQAPRGKSGKPQKVTLPEGFLAHRDDPTP